MMKKPNISKRLLPLLDVIFILLIFFIILPHGIKSTELLEIGFLEQKTQRQSREIKYYRWKYGPTKGLNSKSHNVLNLGIKNDKLYIESKLISQKKIETKLKSVVEGQETTFVIIKIVDLAGEQATRRSTIKKIISILDQLRVIHIIAT